MRQVLDSKKQELLEKGIQFNDDPVLSQLFDFEHYITIMEELDDQSFEQAVVDQTINLNRDNHSRN